MSVKTADSCSLHAFKTQPKIPSWPAALQVLTLLKVHSRPQHGAVVGLSPYIKKVWGLNHMDGLSCAVCMFSLCLCVFPTTVQRLFFFHFQFVSVLPTCPGCTSTLLKSDGIGSSFFATLREKQYR